MKQIYANGGGMDFLKRLLQNFKQYFYAPLSPAQGDLFFLDKKEEKSQGCIPLCYLALKNLNDFELSRFIGIRHKIIFNGSSSARFSSRNVRPIEQDLFGLSLTSLRQFFGYAPRFLRDLFETCSTGLRLLFGYSSTHSRRTVEAHPKDSRSCPEAVSNLSRSGVEDHSKKTKRKVEEMDCAMCEFVRYEKASNPITTQAQPKDDLRTAQEIPNNHPITRLEIPKDGLSQTLSKTFLRNVYTRGAHNKKLSNIQPTDRENTVLKQGRGTAVPPLSYCSPTKVALQSYYGSTKELLNTYVLVTPQYNSSRSVVVPKTKGSLSIAKYVKLLASKCLRPIAYGLMLILVSMFSLSDAWAQSAETQAAEGQVALEATSKKIFPIIKYAINSLDIPKIKIGESIPESIMQMPLYSVQEDFRIDTIRLKDLEQHGLIVLDFWARWCAPCIHSVEKWERYSRSFGDYVNLLNVHLDYDYKAWPFASSRSWVSPIIIGENAWKLNRAFFPETMVSRVVWIVDGKLFAITGTQTEHAEDIVNLLTGKQDVSIQSVLDYSYSAEENVEEDRQ